QLLFCIRQKLVEPFRKPIGIDEWIRLSRLPYRELLAALKGLEGIRMIRDRHLGSSAQSHDALDAVDVRLRRLDSAEILTVATEEERFVFLPIIKNREFDRRHSRRVPWREIQLQCCVSELDRVSILNDDVSRQFRHHPITFGHHEPRTGHRLYS